MANFELLALAADDYPDPPGALEASADAMRLRDLLSRVTDIPPGETRVVSNKQDLEDTLEAWARHKTPRSTIIYFVGHGEGDLMFHNLVIPDPSHGVVRMPTTGLVKYLVDEWAVRQQDNDAWVLVILDCCQSSLGKDNMALELYSKHMKRPGQVSVWPVNGKNAAMLGAFVTAFEQTIDGFNENDAIVTFNEVFRRIRDGENLGKLEKFGDLPKTASFVNPRAAATPIMATVDAYAELQTVLDSRDATFRSHFLSKAQGAESGELDMYFAGRDVEIDVLCTWIHSADSGLKVVTGGAGSGKSALLGHLAVLADHELVSAYVDNDLAAHLANSPQPPDQAFDLLLHLTGKTLPDVTRAIMDMIQPFIGEHDESHQEQAVFHLLGVAATSGSRDSAFVVLADALDESQEPERIAAFLAELGSGRHCVQVIVGTRRSTLEGPDVPADTNQRDLLDALKVDDTNLIELEADPAAVRIYVFRRLRAAGHDEEAALHLAERIAATDQPFLFARLAVSEIKHGFGNEMPANAELDDLLSKGHRGIFGFAVQRIGEIDQPAAIALEALALARGRGFPRDRGVWLLASQVVGQHYDVTVTEQAIDAALEHAAAYITLDAEAGVSTYRLAHQTFVEFFQSSNRPGPRRPHAAIAHALIEANESSDPPWGYANQYELRYVIEHLTLATEGDAWDEPLDAVFTSGGWIRRASELCPLETVLDLLETLHRRVLLAKPDQGGLREVEVVASALRRSRAALARNPKLVGPMLHGRLMSEPSELRGLGAAISNLDSGPWLELVQGDMTWTHDLNTKPTAEGTARALAFGHVDGAPLVAIAVEERIDFWDPRTGETDRSRSVHFDKRPTALAFGVHDGRPILGVAFSYDGLAQVIDLDGDPVGGEISFDTGTYLDLAAIGAVGDDNVLVLSSSQPAPIEAYRVVDGDPVSLWSDIGSDIRGVAELDGQLVCAVIRRHDSTNVIEIRDSADKIVHSRQLSGPAHLTMINLTRIGADIWCAGAEDAALRTWTAAGKEKLSWPDAQPEQGEIRALVMGSIADRPVVTTIRHHNDPTTPVELHEPGSISGSEPNSSGPRERRTVSDPLLPRRDGRLPDVPGHEVLTTDPARWPPSSYQEGIVDNVQHAITGSLDGSAVLWRLGEQEAVVVGGPYRTPAAQFFNGSTTFTDAALGKKGGPQSTVDAAVGVAGMLGPVVAIAHEGSVSVHQASGSRLEPQPDIDLGTVKAVAVGSLADVGILVTGSKAGRLSVIRLDNMTLVAEFQLDSEVTQLAIDEEADLVRAQVLDLDQFAFRLNSLSP